MTEFITNDLGHIMDRKHRSSSSPWGTFIGTWQAERKPIQLLTECEFQIDSKKVNVSMPTSGAIGTTQQEQAKLNDKSIVPNINIKSTGDKLKVGTPVQTVCSPSQNKEPEPVKTEPVATLEPGNVECSRPESRMAQLEMQSPLKSRPPSSTSEVLTTEQSK